MMVGEGKGRDSVSFFRIQLTTRGTSIVNPWTPWILHEQVPFLFPSWPLFPALCAEVIVSAFFPSVSPPQLREATSTPSPR